MKKIKLAVVCSIWVFIHSVTLLHCSEYQIGKKLKYSKEARTELLKIAGRLDKEILDKRGNFNQEMDNLKKIITKYPNSTSALTAKLRVAILIKYSIFYSQEMPGTVSKFSDYQFEILDEIVKTHKMMWQGAIAQSHICGRYKRGAYIKCLQSLSPSFAAMDNLKDPEFLQFKNIDPRYKNDSLVLKGQDLQKEFSFMKEGKVQCDIPKESPKLPDLNIEQENYNQQEIVQKFFGDASRVEKDVQQHSFGTWTEYSANKSVKFGSWGDIWFKVKAESMKPVTFDKHEAEKKAREFLKTYTKELGDEVSTSIVEEKHNEKVVAYKVIFTHAYKGIPIISDVDYAGDRIEVKVTESGITEAVRFWHKVTGNASEPKELILAQKAIDEVLAKGHLILKTNDFKITSLEPVYFVDWMKMKPTEKPVMQAGWKVGMSVTGTTKEEDKFLCISGLDGKVISSIVFLTKDILDEPGKAIH